MRRMILFSGLLFFTQIVFGQLSWTKEIHDFGQAQLNVPLAYEFSYLNAVSKDQKISFVKSSTNNIKPNWDNVTIQMNQTGVLFLTYLPSKSGVFKETLMVYLEDNPYPQHLIISGFVGESESGGYYQPSISGNTNVAKPQPVKPQLIIPIREVTPKPERKRIKVDKKKQYQDIEVPQNQPQTENAKPNKPKPNIKVIPNTKPQRPQNNIKPQRPGRPQIISGNTVTASLLKTSILPTYVGNAAHNTAANEAYFTNREKAMIQEINLLRSNPTAYANVVKTHVAIMEADKSNADYYRDEIKYGKELIAQLIKTPSLSILYPSRSIYNATVVHGKEGVQLGSLNHQGKDGLWPWDRVTAADKNMQDGNENIVGGMSDVRKSVLTLLIDAGIPKHLHRVVLLDPKWTHIACYEVGDVGGMPNMWLQTFGQAKVGISPNTPSTGYQEIEKPVKPNVMQKPIKPNHGLNSNIAGNAKPIKPQVSNKPQKPGKPMTQPQTTGDVFGNYTASTKPIDTPVKVEVDELSINDLGRNVFPDADCRTAANAVYMSSREQEMLAEINLLRTQPQRYVEVIEDYIDFINAQISADADAKVFYAKELKSAEELVELLDRLPPLKATKPNRNLYKGAKIYGEEASVSGNLERQGSDGSMPWNRILRYAPNMVDGEENLAYGSTNIRYSIIKLLIDKDDKLRRQRKVLLNPKWDFLAIYEVGKVGNVHYWIQDFGEANATAMNDAMSENGSNEILGFAVPNRSIETNLMPALKALPDGINYEVDYLSEKEKNLLREINFLRTNPILYADIVNEYTRILESKKAKNTVKAAYYQEQIDAAQFIYQKLMEVQKTSAIVPNQMLHNAAYYHGKDCQENGRLEHRGSDGSNTWERLKGAVSGIIDGDQVLVGDARDIREAVVLMLVNQAMYNRSRALVLLQPQWTNIASVAVGRVGDRNDCWIVTLGQL